MDILIDLGPIMDFFNQPPHIFLWRLFWLVGWIPVLFTALWGLKEVWLFHLQTKWAVSQKKILLAIDIPRNNMQSPKAVENMFAYLAGAHSTFDLIEKYWGGSFQLSFSFEIVSIEGYTQFLIRTPEKFRDLIETAVYSQYPDAEITEVNDYVTEVPEKYPDETWDMWGVEFIQAKSPAYPIKLYQEFEHQMGEPETTYRDPMAALMDLMSSLKKGEQFWYQLIVKPIDMNEWTKVGDKEVSSILKEKAAAEKNIFDKLGDSLLGLIDGFGELVYQLWGEATERKEEKDETLKMLNLKPKEKKQAEAIHAKIGKIGFNTKIRIVYVAKKDVLNKPKAVNGFVGYIKQFAAMDLNNLKPDMKITATSAHYFLKERRANVKKNKLIKHYIDRDGNAGRSWGILTTDELATIWHFPIESVVRAPLIQKAPGRKFGPPMTLPIAEASVSDELKEPIFKFEEERKKEKFKEIKKETAKAEEIFAEEEAAPPENLPFA